MVGYKRLMETVPCRSTTPLRGSIWGRFWWRRWRGRCWGMRKGCRKLRCNGAFWCFSAWWRPALALLLWRHGATGERRDAGYHVDNMHMFRRFAGYLAIWHQQPHLAKLYYRRGAITASLWVHRKWVARAQTADDRRRDPRPSE